MLDPIDLLRSNLSRRASFSASSLPCSNEPWQHCTKALDNRTIRTVAGIDLNHDDIVGYLSNELGLLTDLTFLHIKSNSFCGTIPYNFNHLKLLFELNLSNNRFAGKFPRVFLQLLKLKFLDLKFNEFEEAVPKELFDKDLDAIFINHFPEICFSNKKVDMQICKDKFAYSSGSMIYLMTCFCRPHGKSHTYAAKVQACGASIRMGYL
ncbi:hypothetical protein FF1_046788 [Malus domestica]